MLARTPQATALKAKLFRGFSDMSRLSILPLSMNGTKNGSGAKLVVSSPKPLAV